MARRFLILLCVVCSLYETEASPACGLNGKVCIKGQSTCVNGLCQCENPPYTRGDGFFTCYKSDQTYAELKNDPILHTFSDERVPLPYPCRFIFTHVQLKLLDKAHAPLGTCEAIVHAYNNMVNGKFYTMGYDIAFRLSYSNGTSVELSVRNYGTARNGYHSFTVRRTSRDYLPDGPYNFDDVDYTDRRHHVHVRNYINDDNNQMVFEALQCGLVITFVPYDTALLRHQRQVPGLSLSVSCAHQPRFLSNDLTVALPSADCRPWILLKDIQFPGLNKEESLVARAFQTFVVQNQPNPNPECASGHEIMRDCSEKARDRAMRSCYWLLTEDKFIRCLDDTTNGEIILSLFNDCVSSFCDGNNSCGDIIDTIISSGCHTIQDVPQLESFITGHKCPRN